MARRFTFRTFALAVTTFLCSTVGILVTSPMSATAAADSGRCQDVNLPVQLDVLLPATVHGELCIPEGSDPNTVQLLLHGATYDAGYWDFPYQPEKFSYVAAANAAKKATFNIDRVGYGDSTKAPSVALTANAQANVVHQIVEKLHNGAIGDAAFSNVILVGHSLGSAISVLEASTYHDVQGVILTGMTHALGVDSVLSAFTQHAYPAMLDPKFAGSVLDPGYLTTVPGSRDELFYASGDADPGVVAKDEETKELVSATELAEGIALGFIVPTSLAIDVPVLLVNGSNDGLFCQGVLAQDCSSAEAMKQAESGAFSPEAQLETYVLAGAGHDINLSVKAAQWRNAAFDWQTRHFG